VDVRLIAVRVSILSDRWLTLEVVAVAQKNAGKDAGATDIDYFS
jgi:hypothetical protein